MAGKAFVEAADDRWMTGIREWRVRRRILPWDRHFRAEADLSNLFDPAEIFEWVMACVIWVVELVVAIPVGIATILYRQLLRRPWPVVADTDDSPERLTWRVKGWNAAGRKVDEVADRLERGERFEHEADDHWVAPVRAGARGSAPTGLGGLG